MGGFTVFSVLWGSAEHSEALVPEFGFDATGILGVLFFDFGGV